MLVSFVLCAALRNLEIRKVFLRLCALHRTNDPAPECTTYLCIAP